MKKGARKELSSNNEHSISQTTINLQKDTKARLDKSKAKGQCYDGFIIELVNYWARYRMVTSLCNPGRPVPQDVEMESVWLLRDSEQQLL